MNLGVLLSACFDRSVATNLALYTRMWLHLVATACQTDTILRPQTWSHLCSFTGRIYGDRILHLLEQNAPSCNSLPFSRLDLCDVSAFGADMVMEIVGCAASVSQLLVYIALSSGRLEKLCAELKDGSSTYREEESNISILLGIIKRLSRQNIANEDSILPVLIAISTLACQALHLLRPNKVLGINWTPITAHEKIKSAFRSLDKKRTLLHLYISQTHHDALIDLRETIKTSGMSSSKMPMNETPDTAPKGTSDGSDTKIQGDDFLPAGETQERPWRSRVVMTNCTSSGFNSLFNGQTIPEGDFKFDHFNTTAEGVNVFGNEKQPSDDTVLEALRIRSPVPKNANAVPPVAHANMTAPVPAQPSMDRESSPSSSGGSDSELTSTYQSAQTMGQPDIQAQHVYPAVGYGHMNDSGISVSTMRQEAPLPALQQLDKRTEHRSRHNVLAGESVQRKGDKLQRVKRRAKREGSS